MIQRYINNISRSKGDRRYYIFNTFIRRNNIYYCKTITVLRNFKRLSEKWVRQ